MTRLGQNEMRPRRGTPLRVRFSEVLGHCDERAAAPRLRCTVSLARACAKRDFTCDPGYEWRQDDEPMPAPVQGFLAALSRCRLVLLAAVGGRRWRAGQPRQDDSVTSVQSPDGARCNRKPVPSRNHEPLQPCAGPRRTDSPHESHRATKRLLRKLPTGATPPNSAADRLLRDRPGVPA